MEDDDVQKDKSNDPFPKVTQIFKPSSGMNVRAFLLHLKRVAEAKVRTRNITTREHVVDLVISSLDPFECCDFIQSNADKWYSSQNPQYCFVVDFVSRYIPDLNDSSAWDEYDVLMTGPRIEALHEIHSFIQKVKVLKSALSSDWFAEKAEILRLRKRVSLELVLPLCAASTNKPTTFDEWVSAISSGVAERLRELGIQGVPASSPFAAPPVSHVIPPPAVPPTPMDVDAIADSVIARMGEKVGVWGRVGESGTDRGGKRGGKEGKGGNKGSGLRPAKGGKDGKGGKGDSTTNNTTTTNTTTSTSTQCYNCKGWGHLAWQCPSPARSSPNE
jgi:hypothetical protein